ncbi:hypothetical protein TPHA_0E02130 [Tetrapisispora phaffii CBS 4417]|uniref:MAGE domain-containing protein n=1 Tax=Tetrapisispora phaffii (strain ATCC 24235 / CBS 4417 / NBRC 1672 / NRRL Y-8282 / UCD 70-5) TaxID=1071381 RepID=G8BTS7_TETPH|nr:hypothetical protein TPHA_0E02130 [Tetrapisispora phaffii CBS 4417]CCE63305.1 hypothetical protein TPHA_0E02130 [Tetrapisispora phaffii CBS 4417]
MSDQEAEYMEGTPNSDPTATDIKIVHIAHAMIRYILSVATNTNTVITRSRLQDKIRDLKIKENAPNVKFELIFERINAILLDVYGYKLIGYQSSSSHQHTENSNGETNTESNAKEGSDADEIENKNVVSDKFAHRSNSFILINNLKYVHSFESFISLQKSLQYRKTIVDGEYIGNDNDQPASQTLDNSIGTDKLLAMNGILAIVISMIAFSKNNILHNELTGYLQQFGIPIDDTANIPILEMKFSELLKVFVKREYVAKIEENSSMEGDIVTYRLGRRTKAEFPIKSLVSMVQTILNIPNEQLPNLKKDIIKNIGDTYS